MDFSNVYFSRLIEKSYLTKAKKKFFEPNEDPVAFIMGRKSGTIGTFTDYLIITNKRVIIWNRGLAKQDIESINYQNISSVEFSRKILTGEISFNVHGRISGFRTTVRKDAEVGTRLIRERILQSIDEQEINQSAVSSISTQDDPLHILKIRYAKGEITKEEYDEIKKDLDAWKGYYKYENYRQSHKRSKHPESFSSYYQATTVTVTDARACWYLFVLYAKFRS